MASGAHHRYAVCLASTDRHRQNKQTKWLVCFANGKPSWSDDQEAANRYLREQAEQAVAQVCRHIKKGNVRSSATIAVLMLRCCETLH